MGHLLPWAAAQRSGAADTCASHPTLTKAADRKAESMETVACVRPRVTRRLVRLVLGASGSVVMDAHQ